MTEITETRYRGLAQVPDVLTEPGWSLLKENNRLLGFAIYVTELDKYSQKMGEIADKASEFLDPIKHQERLERRKQTPPPKTLQTTYAPLLLEMMLNRSVDGFLTYVSELLALIFRTKPETLRSSETVRVDEVLKHRSIEELVLELAERKVNRLSYQGMRDLTLYLSDHLGLELFSEPAQLEQTVRLVEMRNLLVHNRGVVNDIFISRLRDQTYVKGKPIQVTADDVFDGIDHLRGMASEIDHNAAKKFGLPTSRASDQNLDLSF